MLEAYPIINKKHQVFISDLRALTDDFCRAISYSHFTKFENYDRLYTNVIYIKSIECTLLTVAQKVILDAVESNINNKNLKIYFADENKTKVKNLKSEIVDKEKQLDSLLDEFISSFTKESEKYLANLKEKLLSLVKKDEKAK